MITKALLLFLATMGGAGVLYRGQLQALVAQAAANLRPPAVSSPNVVPPPIVAAPPTAVAAPANPDRLVAGQFHATPLDEPRVRTNRLDNTVSTAGGPVVYPVYRTEVVKQVVVAPPRVIVQRQTQRQTRNAPHQVILHNGN